MSIVPLAKRVAGWQTAIIGRGTIKAKRTCEQRAASSWKTPCTKSQNSFVVIWHWPRMPIQQGCPITWNIKIKINFYIDYNINFNIT